MAGLETCESVDHAIHILNRAMELISALLQARRNLLRPPLWLLLLGAFCIHFRC